MFRVQGVYESTRVCGLRMALTPVNRGYFSGFKVGYRIG